MKWIHYHSFSELPAGVVYDLLKLRQDIFIIEQDCIYEDIDNVDKQSGHLVLQDGGRIAGYARIVPPGVKYTEASIGRIVIEKSYRNSGLGKELVLRALQITDEAGFNNVRIEAQAYLQKFYTSLGFRASGSVYDLDGIPHLEMVSTGNNT